MATASALTARGRTRSSHPDALTPGQLPLDIDSQLPAKTGTASMVRELRNPPRHSTDPGLSEAMLSVLEFHCAFGLPRSARPSHVGADLARLRVALLLEEVNEFADAIAARDLVGIADALADVVYVTYGAAITYGIDLDAAVREVHRSNMSKLDGDGRPVLNADGKVMKSNLYSPPDLATTLFTQAELPI
jgi:predicted HAD superfamily Cof-like phosphohydrolase